VFLANMKFETLMKTAQKATQKTAKKPQRETPYCTLRHERMSIERNQTKFQILTNPSGRQSRRPSVASVSVGPVF
jgi:hypothetical protein